VSAMEPRPIGISGTHRLLLRAALGEGENARAAWREWRQAVSWPLCEVDAGSYSLLPLVFHGLSGFDGPGGEDLGLGRLRGIYRHSWVANEGSSRALGSALALLEEARQKTLLPDGAALALRYYPHSACRPVVRQSLWLEPGQLRRGVELLRRANWRVLTRLPQPLAAGRNLVRRRWLLAQGGCRLDVSAWRPGFAGWVERMPLPIGAGHGRVLDPTGQCLELSWHIRRASSADLPLLLADWAWLIRSAGTRIDWTEIRPESGVERLMAWLSAFDAGKIGEAP